jgi:predicted O-methyltransferase YrrM
MDWHEYKSTINILNEIETHPEARGKDARLFHSISYQSTEIEYLDLLHDLAVAVKPRTILETGTNTGLSMVAMAFAQKRNRGASKEGFSILSVEQDGQCARQAQKLLFALALDDVAKVANAETVEFLTTQDRSQTYDMVYFDSSRKVRIKEFTVLFERKLLNPDALLVFHDTGEFFVGSRPEDQVLQELYLRSLKTVEGYCRGRIDIKCSRGLTIFQY